MSSIGIEVPRVTDLTGQERDSENAAALVADVLLWYRWVADKLETHRDWTDKKCQLKLLPTWARFIDMVNAAMPESAL